MRGVAPGAHIVALIKPQFEVGKGRVGKGGIVREPELHEEVCATITDWLAAQPGGPGRILVLAEEWSSDCRRDIPMLERLREAGGLELRIFRRDGQRFGRSQRPTLAEAPEAGGAQVVDLMEALRASLGRKGGVAAKAKEPEPQITTRKPAKRAAAAETPVRKTAKK